MNPTPRSWLVGGGFVALFAVALLAINNRRESGQRGWSHVNDAKEAPAEPAERPAHAVPEPIPGAPVVAPRATVALEKPADEDAFLRDLELFNVTDKPRALALAEAGERWYGDQGVRAEARRAMRITLLVDLGRMEEARALVREYLTLYPDSRYLKLVQGVTGVHPRPEP